MSLCRLVAELVHFQTWGRPHCTLSSLNNKVINANSQGVFSNVCNNNSVHADTYTTHTFLPRVNLFIYIEEAKHRVSAWLGMTNLLSLSTATQLSSAWPGPCFPASLTRGQAACLLNYPPLPKWSSHFQGERLHGITHFVLGITFSLPVWLSWMDMAGWL